MSKNNNMDSDNYPENQATTTTSRSSGGWRGWLHFQWVRTPIGLLKIGQFILILLGLIIMSTIGSVFGSGVSSLEFFMFIHTTIWVILLIVIILHTLNVYQKLPRLLTCNAVMMISCAVASVMLLICSATVMGKFDWHDTVLAAGSFGIMSMFLFIFETVYYFLKLRREGGFPQPATQTNMADQYQDPVAAEY